MSDPPPPHGQLVAWLKANVVTSTALAFTILTSAGVVLWAGSRWVATYEYRIVANRDDIHRAETELARHQAAIVSLDARINDLGAHTDASDATIRARLDVIEALSRYAADRATQAALPTPGGRR
ncbi:MAG TPA: hypothetical protein VNH21_12420 [Steroidobacteraceae bacterium]|nr:hypothetical protein [Steroidobacteraceae bacterium]